MTKINTTRLIIALVIIGLLIIVFLRECRQKPSPPASPKVDTTYITIRDTVKQQIPVPYEVIKEGKPFMVTKLDTQFIVVVQPVDTIAILQDYFAKRYYRDTAKTTYGYVYILDTITQNKIKYRRVIADWKVPEIHSVTAAPVKNQIYFGLNVCSNGAQLGFGPDIFLKTKGDHIYTLGADYMPGIDKPIFYRVGTKWKIHF